jgi:putative effector of murein hydrolase
MFVANVHVKETSVINSEMMESVLPKTVSTATAIEVMKKMD